MEKILVSIILIFYIVSPVAAQDDKPTNCYDTYMEGHKEYKYAKETWDEWKAKTKGVCQTQTSTIEGGKCEYKYQQISPETGETKWLCWYGSNQSNTEKLSTEQNDCNIDVKSKSTKEFLAEIPSLDSSLKSCPVPLKMPFTLLLGGTRTILINISSGEKISLQITDSRLSGIRHGSSVSPSYIIEIERCKLDAILASSNRFGALAYYWLNDGFNTTAIGLLNKFKLWISNIVVGFTLQKAAVQPSENCAIGAAMPIMSDTTGSNLSGTAQNNKPTNCYDTYMEGHKEYKYAKETWDEWKAKTKGVCQTQTSTIEGGKCEYKYQQISPETGETKWLCWYN